MILVHGRMESKPALHGTAHIVVLDPVTEEVLERSVVGFDHQLDLDAAVGCEKELAHPRRQPEAVGGLVKIVFDHFEHHRSPA